MSLLTPDELSTFIHAHGLPGTVWPEAATAIALNRELQRIRAEARSLYEPSGGHVQAVAVPVPIHEAAAHVALGMYYPSVRAPLDGTPELRESLSDAAAAIAEAFERQ